MKPDMKPDRRTAGPEKSDGDKMAERIARRAAMERDLTRRILAWARSHERCPLHGCRRNGRCLKPENCRAVTREEMTDAERLELGRQVMQALAAFRADGDGQRAEPLPQGEAPGGRNRQEGEVE